MSRRPLIFLARIVFLLGVGPAIASGQTETLPLTLEEATRRALERNTTLAVERENVQQAGFAILSPAYSTDVGIAFRQPLLRDLAIDPAREALRVAAADRSASEARLTRVVSDTIRQVDASYWSLVAARRDVLAIESAVTLADKQLSETKSRVEAGMLGETEIAQPDRKSVV